MSESHNKALHRNFATLRFAKSRELGRYLHMGHLMVSKAVKLWCCSH